MVSTWAGEKLWISPLVNSEDRIDVTLLLTLWISLSTSDFALRATTGQDDPTSRRVNSTRLMI